MAKPKANLSIAPLTPDDVHLYQAIRHETFRPTINKILYAREPSKETQQKVIEKYKQDITDNKSMFTVCWDNDTGEMIAGSKWRYLGPKAEKEGHANVEALNGSVTQNGDKRPKDRTWEEVEEGLTIVEPYPESDPRVWNTFFTQLYQNKREIMGTRPYYALDTLITHPRHHRRGAGGLLVQWGCEQADVKGVEAYLEASPMGAPLYERYGFQRIKMMSLDLRDFGGDEKLDFIVSHL